MAPDAKGFPHPVIDESRCVSCGLCTKVCPVLSPVTFSPRAEVPFAAWANDDAIRRTSSSGGLFSALADQVIKQGGAVNGVAFDKFFNLTHRIIETKDDVAKSRGSKYVQSSVGLLYKEVERMLKTGRTFFFTSTPCQVAGLLAYLGRTYDNLITCDILCHGVPSPGKFKTYLVSAVEKHGINGLIGYEFRKLDGWGYAPRMFLKDGSDVRLNPKKDVYFQDFINGCGFRSSCYSCLYARPERIADLTLGDFWGVPISFQCQHNSDKGISLLLVNTAKGMTLVKQCQKTLSIYPRTWGECKSNHPLVSPARPQGTFARSLLFRALRFAFIRLPRKVMFCLMNGVYGGKEGRD